MTITEILIAIKTNTVSPELRNDLNQRAILKVDGSELDCENLRLLFENMPNLQKITVFECLQYIHITRTGNYVLLPKLQDIFLVPDDGGGDMLHFDIKGDDFALLNQNTASLASIIIELGLSPTSMQFSPLLKLEKLDIDISDVMLAAHITDLGHVLNKTSSIKYLSVKYNRIRREMINRNFISLPNLEELKLELLGLTAHGFANLTYAASNLRRLDVSTCYGIKTIVNRIKSFSELEELDLSGTDINIEGLFEIATLPNLKILRLAELEDIFVTEVSPQLRKDLMALMLLAPQVEIHGLQDTYICYLAYAPDTPLWFKIVLASKFAFLRDDFRATLGVDGCIYLMAAQIFNTRPASQDIDAILSKFFPVDLNKKELALTINSCKKLLGCQGSPRFDASFKQVMSILNKNNALLDILQNSSDWSLQEEKTYNQYVSYYKRYLINSKLTETDTNFRQHIYDRAAALPLKDLANKCNDSQQFMQLIFSQILPLATNNVTCSKSSLMLNVGICYFLRKPIP